MQPTGQAVLARLALSDWVIGRGHASRASRSIDTAEATSSIGTADGHPWRRVPMPGG